MRYSVEQNIVVGNSSTHFLPMNPRRRGIVVTTDTNPVYITAYNVAAATAGIQVPNGIQPTHMCCLVLGEWITFQLQIIAPAGNTNVCVIEVLADPVEDYADSQYREYHGT